MAPLHSTGESGVAFASGEHRLFGVLHMPADPAGTGVVICAPLFEERKSAHGPLVDLARRFADAGYPVLRFDYRGCGDSEGDLSSFRTDDWIDDIHAAAGFLREASGAHRIALAGLRAGATLALQAAKHIQPSHLMLWDPVPNGRDYVLAELRKKLMKEMVTFGRSRATREALIDDLANGKSVDLDGYELSPALFERLDALALSPPGCPTLLAHLSPRDTLPAPLQRVREQCRDAGADISAMCINERPFWNLVGRETCPTLIDATTEWLGAN
jgi:exosortase A-associated hydrolase 2